MKIESLGNFERVDRNAEVMDTPYDRWVESQGVDVIRGYFVQDLKEVPMKWWDRKGGHGVYINLEGAGYLDDAFVVTIPPGKSLNPEKHIYDELVYVLSGRGATTLWQGDGKGQSFEWQEGSLFAIPVNATYQHFNGSGDREVKLLGVTNAPLVYNIFHNEDFVMNNPFAFRDRFDDDQDFRGHARLYNDRVLETNFIPDVANIEPIAWEERGKGSKTVFFELVASHMGAHVSEFPVGRYKKAHRHGPGAHVMILSGEGYSLMWPEGEEKQQFIWKPGSLVVPPEGWFHQHFNSGPQPARYLALKMLSRMFKLVPGPIQSDVPLNQGGWQIEHEDEDEDVIQLFVDACGRSGAKVDMAHILERQGAA